MTKMIIRSLSLLSICFLLCFSVSAQKVKYKDLIILLSSKQYEKAEPFLKRYLRENDDNPNSFLYMGIIYQEKALLIDPLLKTEILCSNMDSAALFYDKAYKTINDRELRKNDEYYEAYMRRDLRTGKFVIKLSDVQLDIENRIHAVKEKKDRAKLLKKYFDESFGKYSKSLSIYKSLQSTYGTEKDFFLRSDEAMESQLKSLLQVFDSAIAAFDKYKIVSKELGKTGYSQLIDLQEIKDIKRDGSGAVDFLKDDLKLWDYRQWANASIQVIQNGINPMRDNLVAYDIEANKLREKLKTDSVSVKPELKGLTDKLASIQLKNYDPDPMPLDVFGMKITELEYHSNIILNRHLRGSSNVHLRLNAIKSEITDLNKLDSISSKLTKRNFDDEERDYRHFITKVFGTTSVLKSTISTTQEYAKRERLKKEKEWEAVSQLLKWIVNAPDSIPLFVESNRDLKFKPLVIEQEKYTFGLAFQDTLATGYFYTIQPSRLPDLKAVFPVDQTNFTKRNFSLFKGLSTTDGTGNAFVLLSYSSRKVRDKFPSTLTKIYRTDGLAWSINFSFEMLPSEITLNNGTGEISVKISGNNGEDKIVSFDKSGKPKLN